MHENSSLCCIVVGYDACISTPDNIATGGEHCHLMQTKHKNKKNDLQKKIALKKMGLSFCRQPHYCEVKEDPLYQEITPQ